MNNSDNDGMQFHTDNPRKISCFKIIWLMVKLVVVIAIFLIKYKAFSVERSYERIWKIKFANCVVLSEDHKSALFSDDKYRYTVFEVNKLMRRLQVYNNYQNEFDDTCEAVMAHFGNEIAERPDFEGELTCLSMIKGDKELIMLYSHNEHRLYCFVHPV